MADRFAAVLEQLRAAEERPDTFAQPFVEVLPVTGATVSTVGAVLGSETIAATDDLAARIDELQFDLSEGPCWDALNSKRPVLEPTLQLRSTTDWPTFAPAAAEYGVSSVFAFPLVVGALALGAIDLYSIQGVMLDREQRRKAVAMSDVIGRHVLGRAIRAGELPEIGNESSGFSRRVVHQATGFVIAQLGASAEDARLIIQAHAFAAGRTMIDVATEIVNGELSFTRGDDGIEASE